MSNLFTELKRRNVFKVAVAYLVVSWLTVQVAETLTPRMALPDWVPSLIIILLIVGFPIALLFAWAFELTPDGVKPTSEVDADSSISKTTSRKIDFIIIGALVFIIGGMGYERMTMTPPPIEVAETPITLNNASIAVLAFADLSPNGDQEYFGDGISESLLNVLAKIKELDVSPRTSSFAFKGKNRNVPDIGQILNVKHVLEGSVKKARNRVLITAQLIDAPENRHLWSDTYERELTTENIFAIQAEIATEIVKALSEELGIGIKADVRTDPLTANMNAYELYLQAMKERRVRTTKRLKHVLELLDRVVELDSKFAGAWAIYAQELSWFTGWDQSLELEPYQLRAIDAAEKALALNPSLRVAYNAQISAYGYLHEWEKANDVLSQAQKHIPDFDLAPIEYMSLGYLKKGYEEAVISSKLDPNYGFNYTLQAIYFGATGQTEISIETYKRAILNGYQGGQDFIVEAHWEMGDTSHWISHYSKEISDLDPELLPLFPHLYELRAGMEQNEQAAVIRFQTIVREMGFGISDLLQKGPRWGLRVPYDIAVALGGAEKVANFFWTNEPKFWMWSRSLHEFRQTDAFRSRVRSSGMLAYWQKHGWPDLCRAKGDDDFECD